MAPQQPALAERVATQLADYSAQGVHRTGTEVDWASAAWLQRELTNAGVPSAAVRQRTFPLQRLDAGPAYLHVEGSCTLGGLGMFDCGSYTDLRGVAGSVGWAGSDAPIGVVLVDDANDASDSKRLNAARSAPGARKPHPPPSGRAAWVFFADSLRRACRPADRRGAGAGEERQGPGAGQRAELLG